MVVLDAVGGGLGISIDPGADKVEIPAFFLELFAGILPLHWKCACLCLDENALSGSATSWPTKVNIGRSDRRFQIYLEQKQGTFVSDCPGPYT